MDGEEVTKIPFGAFDSELKGWEYTIPEGMEAVIKDGKIIVREKENEDERIRKEIISFIQDDIDEINLKVSGDYDDRDEDDIAHQNWCKKAIAWLEKQGEKNKHTKHPDMVANLKEYLANTPKEQLEKDWDELKHWNNVGPTVEEFLYGKQNPAWSEEDENRLKVVITFVNSNPAQDPFYDKGCLKDWLKTLKDRVQPQPKSEWSEADERNASYICAALDCYFRLREERNNTNGQEDLNKARNWLYNKLNSIKPQNIWKPSDGQMQAFKAAIDRLPHHEALHSLYIDLKKLKG